MSAVEVKTAKAICHQCPVRRNCLIYAFTTDQQWGVWGALTAAERERALLFFETIEGVIEQHDQGVLERQVLRRGRS